MSLFAVILKALQAILLGFLQTAPFSVNYVSGGCPCGLSKQVCVAQHFQGKAWRDSTPGCLSDGVFMDLGGHLDVTLRAKAGTLDARATEATSQVIMVGAVPLTQTWSCGS